MLGEGDPCPGQDFLLAQLRVGVGCGGFGGPWSTKTIGRGVAVPVVPIISAAHLHLFTTCSVLGSVPGVQWEQRARASGQWGDDKQVTRRVEETRK